MSVKEFFKGNVFKCLIALLCVLLVSGIFLTVMNSLLYVTDEERFERAINKIYGKSVKTESVQVADYNSNATINEAYKIKDDGNYLVKSTGKGGFENGTVTCWVVVKVKGGKVSGVGKVVIDSNKSQSYISKISQSFLNSFESNPAADFYFTTADGYLTSGASMSSNAICNAVNGAVDFVNAQLGNLAEDIYADFMYVSNINTKLTSHEYNAETKEVVFHIATNSFGNAVQFSIDVTVGENGIISDYTITKNGSTGSYASQMLPSVLDGTLFEGKDIDGIMAILKDGADLGSIGSLNGSELITGATQSNYLCISAAAFAAANYQAVTELEQGGEENE
ncbi:MAG: hypothetical protein K2L42_00215 [Clostridia bacterium]|nr:hypothetical protein [Clostridia bacterium]